MTEHEQYRRTLAAFEIKMMELDSDARCEALTEFALKLHQFGEYAVPATQLINILRYVPESPTHLMLCRLAIDLLKM